MNWKIWEKFRNKSGTIYMTRYSHNGSGFFNGHYIWHIYDVTTPDYQEALRNHWTEETPLRKRY